MYKLSRIAFLLWTAYCILDVIIFANSTRSPFILNQFPEAERNLVLAAANNPGIQNGLVFGFATTKFFYWLLVSCTIGVLMLISKPSQKTTS
jgi:hypothetical protein